MRAIAQFTIHSLNDVVTSATGADQSLSRTALGEHELFAAQDLCMERLGVEGTERHRFDAGRYFDSYHAGIGIKDEP